MSFNIAIDGPAGAGKSTVARQVAARLGFIYVDTGAMYRAMALYLLQNGIRPDEENKIREACRILDITIAYENGEQQVVLNGKNVTGHLREEAVGNMASVSSAIPAVREKLTQLQKKLADTEDVVMDGRDIGTQVLPDAQVKIYLTADVGVRARRRYEELRAKGITEDIRRIEEDIEQRDFRDMHREISPLRQAEDAVFLDTSNMDLESVIRKVIEICEERRRVS